MLTAELEAVVSTDVAAGDTLKVEAAAGSGKSTAVRLYAERRPALRILYLTFTAVEAREKEADYKRPRFTTSSSARSTRAPSS